MQIAMDRVVQQNIFWASQIFWAMGEKSIQNMVDIKVEGHTSSVISAFQVVLLNRIWKDKIFTVYERDAIRTNPTSESNPLVGAVR